MGLLPNQFYDNYIRSIDADIKSVRGAGLIAVSESSGIATINYDSSKEGSNEAADYVGFIKTLAPIALWACEMVSDGDMVDEMGNGHSLTLSGMHYGAPALCRGSTGSISGTDTSDYSASPTGTSSVIELPITGDMSVSFWAAINVDTPRVYSQFLDRYPSFNIDVTAGKSTSAGTRSAWDGSSFRGLKTSKHAYRPMANIAEYDDPTIPTKFDPVMVTLTYDHATQSMKSYSNGCASGERTVSELEATVETSMRFFSAMDGSNKYPFMFDTLGVWDRVLTYQEVLKLYNYGVLR